MAGEAQILEIGEHVVTVMCADGRAAEQVDQLGELRDAIWDGTQGIRGVVDDDGEQLVELDGLGAGA